MPLSFRRTLLALAGSAATALPAFAQSLPPVHATPPAHTTPAAPAVSGADLFDVIADYADARAAEAAKLNDEIAYTSWVVIRNTFKMDEKTKALMQSQTQGQVALGFRSALVQARAENPKSPTSGGVLLHALFLGDLYLDNATAKEGTGWVVSKERLDKLHADVCAEAAAYCQRQQARPVVRPVRPTVVASPTAIPLSDPTPRPLAPPPVLSQSPTYIPLTPTPLPADIQDNIDSLEKHRQWYAEQKKIWDQRDAERQKKWEANLAAMEADKPLPHPDVQMFPESMRPTMALVETSNRAIDALNNPAKYTEAERERIFNQMRGHEQANRLLNTDLAWRQLVTKFEQDVNTRQTKRIEEHFRVNPNGPLPSPSINPTIR